jgi:peroxidase
VKPGLCDRRRDGSLDRQYGDFLQRKCAAAGDAEYVELDGETPTRFDNQYYKNLMHGKGLLPSDQKMLLDSRTKEYVRSFAKDDSASRAVFVNQFAQSMRRLSEKQVLTGDEGGVRHKFSAINY